MMGAVMSMLSLRLLLRSYLPPIGLAAAKILALRKHNKEVSRSLRCFYLAFSVAFTPALVMVIVCCSIAS